MKRPVITKFWNEKAKDKITGEKIELFYILSGNMKITIGMDQYELHTEDIILTDFNETGKWELDRQGLMIQLSVDYFYLCSQMRGIHPHFSCNSIEEEGEKYNRLKKIIEKIAKEYIATEQFEGLKYTSYTYQLLLLITEEFSDTKKSEIQVTYGEDARLSAMLDYIYMNYDREISLTELTDRLYVSVSSLSRFFSKKMGMSFVEYVKRFRLQKVKEDLKMSKASITQIAVENGFSNSSSMNQSFKEMYQITPTEYRDLIKEAKKVQQEKEEQSKKKIIRRLAKLQNENTAAYAKENEIIIDGGNDAGYFETGLGILNVGPAADVLNAEIQRQILVFWKDFDYSYMRLWNVFSKRLIMSTEEGKTLNYYFLDQVLDFFVNNGIPLFLDIGRMTETIRENEKNVLYAQETRLEFESEGEWCEFLMKFLNHLADRYGERLIEKWIFEFSFFLNDHPYYRTKGYQAKRAWEVSVGCVKSVFPNIKVAGPGLLAEENMELTEMIVHDFLSARIRPDIFTSFHFPYMVVMGNVKLLGELKKIVRTDFLKEKIEEIRHILKQEQFEGEFYVTDWNYSVSNRSYLEDSSFRAAFLVKNILQNRKNIDMLGVWYASDVISNYGDMSGPLIGSAGIMTVHGIKKPSYYALEMLEQLGTHIIAEEDNFIITKKNENSYQILCFHYVGLGPKFFLTEENSQGPEEIYHLFEGNARLHLEFTLENITNAQYSIRQTIVNEDSGSVLKRWIELGAEKELSVSEREYLEASSYPMMLKEQLMVNNRKIKMHISLKPNEVRLIQIRKER